MKFDLTQSDKDQAFAPKEDFGFLDYAGDILAAPVRGIAGAAEGVYDLTDWVFQDWLPDAEDNFGLGHSKTLAGGLVQGMSQFLTGFVPVFGQLGKASQALGWAGKTGKLAKAGKGTQWAANFGKSTLAGAVADATVFDAHEQRLSNLLNQFPSLKNPVSEYLAADENDSEFEGRIKNMIEGGVLGFAMEPFIMGLRSMKAGRAAKLVGGDPEKAANQANQAARTRKVQEKMPHLSLDEAQTTDAIARSTGIDILDDTIQFERGVDGDEVGTTTLRQMPDGTTKEAKLLGTFVSKAHTVMSEAIANPKIANKQTAQQLRAMLTKQGVKEDEMFWSGLDDYLAVNPKATLQEASDAMTPLRIEEVTYQNKYSIMEMETERGHEGWEIVDEGGRTQAKFDTEDDAIDHLVDNYGMETKYSSETLHGGEDYTELLITTGRRKGGYNANFQSGHYDDENVLGHVRFNTRKGPKGEKVLFLEEVQSDWHQAGRKQGYKSKNADHNALEKVEQDINTAIPHTYENTWLRNDERTVAQNMRSHMLDDGDIPPIYREKLGNELVDAYERAFLDTNIGGGRVPNAPFKKTWDSLLLKRMTAYAVENGFDAISWTTGKQQAKRYDLSAKVDSITWQPETKELTGWKNGEDMTSQKVSEAELPDHIGKDAADKLIKSKKTQTGDHIIEGQDLEMGSKGMEGFYDKILVSTANKIGKKFGSKVGREDLGFTVKDENTGRYLDPEGNEYEIFRGQDSDSGLWVIYDREDTSMIGKFSSRSEAEATLKSEFNAVGKGQDSKNPYLPISKEMKASVKSEGLPLFQKPKGETGATPKGSVTFEADGKAVIKFFGGADVSTAVHEVSHVVRRRLFDTTVDQARRAGVSDVDIRTAEDWAGATRDKDGNVTWTVAAEEKFARGFEQYLKSGKAPTKELQGLFTKFAAWMKAIYDNVAENSVDSVVISPEMKKVFDNLVQRGDIDNVKIPMDTTRGGGREGTRTLAQSPEKAFSADEISAANKTARGAGAVGANAVAPRFAKQFADANLKKGDDVLVFGSGPVDNPMKANTAVLESDYNVSHYDFGVNIGKANDPNALNKQYKMVVAPNVINVQSSKKMLATTVEQMAGTTSDSLVLNVPISPRKGAFTDSKGNPLSNREGADLVEAELRKHFSKVERLKEKGSTPSSPTFIATGPKASALKGLEAKAIKQGKVRRSSTYGVGKQVGEHVYMEKSFASKLPKKAQTIIKKFEKEHPDFDYKVVKFNEKTGDISFIQSRNFDEASEPAIDASIKYTVGEGFSTPRKGSTVYHHKWAMVDDSYKGFSTKESMERTLQWGEYVDRKGIARNSIGSKKNWEAISKDVGASAPRTLDQAAEIPTGASKPPDHPVNLDKFSDVDGAEAIIDAAVRTGSPEFQEGLEAVAKLPHEEIKSQARILSSEFEIVSGAKGLTDDAIENLDNSDELARIVAEQNMLRGYYQEYIRVADDLAEKALTGDDASKVLFMAARQRAEQVGLVVKRNQEKFGQGLNAQRIEGTDMVPKANLMPESAVSDPKYVADYLSDLGGGDATKGTIQVNEIIKRYQAAKAAHDDAGGIKYLRDTVKYSDMLVEYWINSILSGPITHMVNISSNFMNTLFMPLERAMGKALTLQGKEASKELGMYVHLWSQLQDAGSAARSAFKNWGDPLDAMGKLDAERSMDRAIDSKNLPLVTKTIGDTATNFIGKLLNTPSRFLMAEDAFFKHLNYRATVRQGLFREAMGDSSVRGGMSIGEYVETNLAKMVNEGQFYTYKNVRQQAEKAAQAKFAKITDPSEKARKVRASVFRFMKKNWNKEHGNMAKKAREYGREITYTKSLDDPSRSKLVNAAGGFNKWVNDYPMLRLISPFVRTPTNLLAFYLNRSVGAMAELGKYGTTSIMGKSSKDLAGAMAKGGQELDDILGRISTGAMFTFGAVMAVEGGNLTGGGPADPERRRMMEANGWQPYSVRVGDKWMSYRRFDPFSNFFGFVADISESINESTPEEAATLEAILGHVIFAGSRNIMSKSYLTGIARFANVLTQPERYSENYIETTAASMMPFSGLAGQTIGSSDYHKEVRGVLDAMRSKYGLTSATDLKALGVDTKVEDRRNIFGDKLERPNLLLPLPVHQTQIKGDKVLNEISSLNHGFSPPKKDVNGIDTTLYFNNKGQSFYDRWQENHGKVRVGGRTLKQALKALVSSGRYQRLDDKDIEGQGNPRVAEVQKLIRKYRAKALDQSLREFPEVEELYRRNTKIKSYRKAGRDITSLLNY